MTVVLIQKLSKETLQMPECSCELFILISSIRIDTTTSGKYALRSDRIELPFMLESIIT